MKKTKEKLHKMIEIHIESLIRSRDLKEGTCLPPQRELARRFRSSHIPVRQAIQALIDRDLLERIPNKGTFVKKPAAGRVRTSQIAVLYHFQDEDLLRESFYNGILNGINLKAQQEERMLVLRSFRLDQGRHPSEAFRELHDAVDGFVLLGPSREVLESVDRLLRNLDKPVVVLDYEGDLNGVDQVMFNGYANMAAMTDFVAGLGHQTIAFAYFAYQESLMFNNQTNPNFINRLTAWQDGLRRHGLKFDPDLLLELPLSGGQPLFSKLLDRADRPTAIICASDYVGLQVCALAREKGIPVPEELTVTGYDNMPEGEAARPALTTTASPLKEMGRRAIEIILAAQEDTDRVPAKVVLSGTLVARKSHAQVARLTHQAQGPITDGPSTV